MKKLVFFPTDPLDAYVKKGRSYEWLENYYNPDDYFDEIYCLSPWKCERKNIGKIKIIKADPINFTKIIKKIKPDVIRGYGGYHCADWISISKVSGIPTVVSVHDRRPEMMYESLKYSDALFCTSEIVKKVVNEKIKDVTKNIWILPNRVDTDVFKYTENNDFHTFLNEKYGYGKHILHIGRMSDEKNLKTVISALKYLEEDISLICIGQGNANLYMNLAVLEGVNERCVFIERVDNNELPYWYSWCDCFCVPSIAEGFGCVFIEAAACNAAIVTSNIPPMNEFLTNGKNAILIDDYTDSYSVSLAIKKVLAKTDDIENMKSNAREVGRNFSISKINKLEIELYESVIKLEANNLLNIELLRKIRKEHPITKVKQWCYMLLSALRAVKVKFRNK